MSVVTASVFCVLTGSFTSTLYVREMALPFNVMNVVMRATGEYTPCAWWGESPDTIQALPHGLISPGKNWGYWPSKFNPSQAVTHPSTNWGQCCLTYRIWLPTVCSMPSHRWPCNTSWEHFMSHNIYYMSHTIDKWNLYCSYTIKSIFVGIRIPQFDRAKTNRTTASLL